MVKLSKSNIGIAAILVAIAINIIQFFPVDSHMPRNQKAWSLSKRRDVIYLFTRFTNIYAQHDLYFTLRKHASQSVLVMPEAGIFKGRSDFLSGVVGIGNIEKYENRDYLKLDPAIMNEPGTKYTGEMWNSAATRKSGARGVVWELLIKKPNPGKIYVFYDERNQKYTLVDELLLDPGQVRKINES